MINAKDLRIGNWVGGNFPNMIVRSINSSDVDLEMPWAEADNFDVNIEDLQPIPLTPEILLACGFVKDENDDYWIDLVTNYLKAMFMKDGCCPVWFCVAELSSEREQMASLNRINYLHQLQNLYFALTGEELNYSPELLKPTNV